MPCGINRTIVSFPRSSRVASTWLMLVLQLCLLTTWLVSCATGAEQNELQKTIRLRGLPNDEVPVVSAVAIHPTDDVLATSGDDHVVRLWDLQTGRLRRSLRGHSDWVTCVSFSSGGSQLITGGRDRRLLMWDLNEPSRPVPLGQHHRPISNMATHPATDRVAVAGFRAPLKLYDAGRGQLLQTLACPCADTRAIAFSPSGDWLAAGGRNGKLRIWNFRTGHRFDIAAHKRRITSVVFASEDLLVSAGEEQRIHVWDVQQGSKQHTLSHRSGKVLAMTMIDDFRFAAATSQNVIALFHVQDTLPFTVLKGHTGSVADIVARDQQLVSGSFDTTVRIWHIAPDEVRNQAAHSPLKSPTVEPTRSTSVSKRIDPTSPTIE